VLNLYALELAVEFPGSSLLKEIRKKKGAKIKRKNTICIIPTANRKPIMPGGTAVDLRRQSNEHWDGSDPFQSHFDPMQLWGTQVPFVDPQIHAQRQCVDSYIVVPGGTAEDLRREFVEQWDASARSISHFDPLELWGTQILFVDPFNYDEHTFWPDDPAPPASIRDASLSNIRRRLESENGHPRFQAGPAWQAACQETHLPGQGENRQEDWTNRDEYGVKKTGKRHQPETGCISGGTDFENPHGCLDHQDPLSPQRIVQLAARGIDTRPEPQRLPELGPEVVLRMDRVKLRPDQAIYIFQQQSTKTSRTAALLSARFGITPKAIRDIWRQRSWADETRVLETHLHV